MQKFKARAIFTNDAECDDMNSFLHLLLYANDVDIEGLVLSSSCFHFEGDPAAGIEPKRWAGGQWMWDYLDAYEQAYPNLVVHDSAYPTPDYLRSVTCIGNVKTEGDMDGDTDGSELIRKRIFADDPRQLYLLAGGGTNTIARALKRIEEDYKGTSEWDAIYRQVCEKAVIFMIVTQDNTYRDYIAGAWPDLRMLHCTSIFGIAFMFDETVAPADCLHVFKSAWIKPNLLDKGPLPALYHTWFDGHVYPGEEPRSQFGSNMDLAGGNWWGHQERDLYDMISEGDSPSFLYLIDKGLRSLEDPSYGSWGGRFVRKEDNEFNPKADYWCNAEDSCEPPMKPIAYQLTRWIGDWMNDFASRASWCVAQRFEDANHAPEVTIEEGVDLSVVAGESLLLHAKGSDPDGDVLSYGWLRYADADTCEAEVALVVDGSTCEVRVPADAKAGDTIHLIARVTDEGNGRDTYMVNYQRIILTIA